MQRWPEGQLRQRIPSEVSGDGASDIATGMSSLTLTRIPPQFCVRIVLCISLKALFLMPVVVECLSQFYFLASLRCKIECVCYGGG